MADDLFQLLEDAEQQVADEVSAVLGEVADEFAQELADATELVAARFSVSRIAAMFTERVPRLVRRLLRVSEQAAAHTAEATDSELPEEWHDLEGRYQDGRDLPPAMSEYVTVTEHLMRAVGDRLAEAAREELAAGVDAGESIDQLRARLRERFAREGSQLGPDREEGIARTEAGRAWNTATLGAARAATGQDRPLVKQWVTKADTRVRHDHREVNGTVLLLDEEFSVGSSKMNAPHDPSAPASQVVNCRCVLRVHPEVRSSAFDSQVAPTAALENARDSTAAADGSHLSGAMVALMPTPADAERLAIEGGEPVDELHCTMFFLGDDAGQWTEAQRADFIQALTTAAGDLGGPIAGHATGAAHWNTDTDKPSWVWTISDSRDRPDDAPTLGDARQAVTVALADTEHPDVPRQHSPWTAHTCAVYTAESGPYSELLARVGPVTFDRLRVAFGDEHTDIPLGPQQEEEPMPDAKAAATAAPDFVPLTVRTWSTPDPWAIAYEDEETGDGRIFTKGALKWDRQPQPLQHADEMLMGHQGARLAGAIKKVKRDGKRITASGALYLNQPAGLDAVQLLEEEAPLGISVDLDNVSIQLVDKTLSPEDAEWLFASATLAQASVMSMEDGSVMLSASTRAEWTAAGEAFSRSRYDVQLITGPGGVLTAAAIAQAFNGTGALTAAAGDADDPESGLVIHEQKAGEFLLRITDARLRGATLVSMPAFKDAKIVLDPLDETAAAPVPDITAAGETRDRVVRYVCTSPAAVGAREVSNALGMAMSTARGHLNGAAKDGRIVRLAPGLFCGPSTLPEGEKTASGEERIAEDEFHGTPGRPSYRKYHPSGRNARESRRTQHAGGGWAGSNLFSEEQHLDAMLDYQGRAYRDMNALLRRDAEPQRASLDETRHRISALSDLISIQDPLSEDRSMFRGTRQLRLGLKPGDEFHDKGFTSMSDDEDVARGMTGVGGSLFRIKAPKGTQALDVTALGGEKSEAEWITAPGTQFRVTAANEPEDPLETAVYDVEIINGRMASGALAGLALALTAASSGSGFEDRISDWEPDTLVIDRRASAAGVEDELEASAWTAMQQMPPMPAAWFAEPTEEELPDGAGGVHLKDGRAYGWVATIDEPHAGYPGKNLTVRKLAAEGFDFSHFLRAKFQLDDGSFARVGAMTMNVGHHRDGAECETAACQFDDSRTVGAIVTVGLNERGLWFSGAAAPWLSEWDRAVFAACQPSYHLRQARDGSWQLRAVLTVPVPGHSTPLLAALHAVAERSNLALAASAAGLLPLTDEASEPSPDTRPDEHPDDIRTAFASSTDISVDLPGQRPDGASGRHPDAGAPVVQVDVEALAAALASGPLVDLLTDAVTRRQEERRTEIEEMAALVAQHPAAETVAVTNGVI
ncbi:hypothetical protein DI272_18715 [Streptomyces sp. Act143]|uniref:phage minor head protein n=1 Tax=Streptomyces sp. Act143 TaxID=2200760 RepID=UPI000D6761E3|nr:phage minor head protein [Streptomyces sp. Act143]PWI15968.1 hypothetical protein DI272_18715 [Streptomyces sp. Act143]